MRQKEKKQLLEILQTLSEAHAAIKSYLLSSDFSNACVLLSDCQQSAIGIGEFIENIEGETCVAIKLLEDYCELLYQFYEELQSGLPVNESKVRRSLQNAFYKIRNSIQNDIPMHREVVFLPYKASMWDSLESVWKAAEEDPSCDVYVIPIPYFDKNTDGSFGKEHYECDLYPDYVPVTRYDAYDFKTRQPDIIFIHNPYDDCNYVTSVHPFFYSKNLKQFTEQLIYIPYFVLGEVDPANREAVKGIKHFCTTPGVIHADKVIVQSEAMKRIYVDVMTEFTAGRQGYEKTYWKNKILGLGSPKIDKVQSIRREDLEIPQEWKEIIQKPDGSRKKIILYNTSVSTLLQHGNAMLRKMNTVFQTFFESRETVALLWRPHPLIQATIESMKPELWKEYRAMVNNYRSSGWGIYDDTPELDRAIGISDGYYGDWSSLVELCRSVGMPVMIQNVEA